MSNLGFTWFPKDWWSSDTFFELPPELRYIYMEIISMLYLNDGSWRPSRMILNKRFGVDVGESGFELLKSFFTILEDESWTHESVNKRLRKAIAARENGKKGGRPPSKEKPKKPMNETQKNPPYKTNQIESKLKETKAKELNDKKSKFAERIQQHINSIFSNKTFTKKDAREFYSYWSEHNDDGWVMRFEKEKAFNTKRRITTWMKRSFKENSEQSNDPPPYKMGQR